MRGVQAQTKDIMTVGWEDGVPFTYIENGSTHCSVMGVKKDVMFAVAEGLRRKL